MQESATLQRMEAFMERFSSTLPPSDAGQTLPPQTVASEQGEAEVDSAVVVDRADPPSISAVVTAGSDGGHGDSDGESEVPPPSFLDTINSVYHFLSEEQCPQMALPPPRVKSLFEMASVQEPSKGMPKLPFSPTVGLLVKEIEGQLVEDGRRAGNYVPKAFVKRQGTPKFYTPHNVGWPVKPPTLDKDAALIGVTKTPTPASSIAKVWDNTDVRMRAIVAMASHIDLCLGASRGALAQEDGVQLESLLQSAAKATRDILGTALTASTDILLWRRDAALSSSSLLAGPSREALRAAPLSSSTLLGGLCEKASQEDVAARQRVFLTRQTSFGASSSSKKKSFKAPSRSGGRYRQPQVRPQRLGLWGRGMSPSFNLLVLRPLHIRYAAEGPVAPGEEALVSLPVGLAGGGDRETGGALCLGVRPTSPVSAPVGGRISRFPQQWGEITNSKWVLDIIRRGYRIPFREEPPSLTCTPPQWVPYRDVAKREALASEVSSLLAKNAIEEVRDVGSPGFYSHLFVVPKRNGKLRPVLDLSALNRSVLIDRFKMETVRTIRDTVLPGVWAVSIDLQDAYLHVPIRRSSRKFLRFVSEGKFYQFSVLPFGLSTAPRVFTILMEAVASAARRMGVSLLQYLDDWLLFSQSRGRLLRNLATLWDLILSLGLIPNLEKSELIPSQNFSYVGMNFLTDLGIVRLPEERIVGVLAVVFQVLDTVSLSARRLLSLLGMLSAAADLLPLAVCT